MTGRLFIENVPTLAPDAHLPWRAVPGSAGEVVTCKNIFELFRTLRLAQGSAFGTFLKAGGAIPIINA
jgi:hypothetical protein